ncbi:MAG: glycosyltransferase [Chloroflexi bacterium]|nr:glycosyltransferase [Chloroflexota bacterium]
MKFAVVSHVLPPLPSGQAVVLSRILKTLKPDSYCLITQRDHESRLPTDDCSSRLSPRPYRTLNFQLTRGYRYGLVRIRKRINLLLSRLGTAYRSREIAEILRRERCDAVVACTGDLINLPAAYLASRKTGVRFYPYIFDYYSYQWRDPGEHRFAGRYEPIILRAADGVIVPNEVLRDELQCRYGVEATVIHNPCALDVIESPINEETSPDADTPAVGGANLPDREFRILYTGAVYEAQLDALQNLVAALKLIPEKVSLHLYTVTPTRLIEKMGLTGPVICHDHAPLSSMNAIQKQADLLFLPLAFNSPFPPEVIRTSAPGKMGEYLAAGKPVLVHAPADSYPAVYFRRHRCGLVVDREDPVGLAGEIRRLIKEPNLGKQYCNNAWARAQADFSVSAARRKFAELLGINPAEFDSGE